MWLNEGGWQKECSYLCTLAGRHGHCAQCTFSLEVKEGSELIIGEDFRLFRNAAHKKYAISFCREHGKEKIWHYVLAKKLFYRLDGAA